MTKTKWSLFFIISCILFFAFWGNQQLQKNRIHAVEGTNDPDGFVVEIDKTTGKILKGQAFIPDKPVIRPMYQGDATTLLGDVIGPEGKKFTSFSDTQQYKEGDHIIYGNVGTYNNRSLALKIDLLGTGSNKWVDGVKLSESGVLSIGTPKSILPMYYQLVYNEAGYPPVQDVYLELSNEMDVWWNNTSQGIDGIPKVSLGSKNLKKVYLTIPSDWSNNQLKRSYSLNKSSTSTPPYVEYFSMNLDSVSIRTSSAFSTISDNSEKTLLKGDMRLNITGNTRFFPVNLKSPWSPIYLPPHGNEIKNSNTFDVTYNLGQGLIDTYEANLPKSLKIVVEDTKGYFNNLTHGPIEFVDKQNNPIRLGLTTEVVGKKLVVTIPKVALKQLESNQVNMKLNFGADNLNVEQVLENYAAEKGFYTVPLSVYNIRTLESGIEAVSEKNEINATITPTIYGNPMETTALIGSSSEDLDVNQLVKDSGSTIPGDSVILTLPETKLFDTAGRIELPVKMQSTENSSLTKIVTVPINVSRGEIVTSSFFENQSWLIDAINTQFAPRKIDQDIYQSDLLMVKKIVVANKSEIYQGQHIPATISALKNLEFLAAVELGLRGTLPNEIGNLQKLYHLAVGGNAIEGIIPSSFSKLAHLSFFSISNTKIGGTIPKEFVNFSKLTDFFVNNTFLVGQVPNFSRTFNTSSFSNTQLTYNSAELPPFSGGIVSRYEYSFLPTEKQTLQLIGNKIVSSSTETIKPFDQANVGYFDLAVQKPDLEGNSTKEALYPAHYYTIKDKQNGRILYEGFGEKTAEIAYQSAIEYQITLDEAFDNPANNWTIKGKIPELKFNEIPTGLTLEAQVNNDGVDKTLSLNGELAIFDNRDEKQWKLKMTPSYLVDGKKQLQGEYIYTDSSGNEKIVVDNQAILIEKGDSSEEEIIPISAQWDGNKGLRYCLKPGNLLGSYKGSITWTLEDAP